MSTTDAPIFPTIAIVGVGLIGGSIAFAIRERWPSTRIVGVDRPQVLAHVSGSGALDRGADSVGAIGEVDLIVLAAPVRENRRVLGEIARTFDRPPLVTDVGGTKHDIVQAARAVGLSPTFVGGHPLGGAERGGFGFARPDLFMGRPWIFTPETDGPSEALDRLFALAAGLGARPTTMAASDHDRLMAFVSHLPQLAASALMDVVGQAAQADGLRLAGRGLVDTTRLASSPASVWRDVTMANAEALAEALDALIAVLVELRADLPLGRSLSTTFEAAGRWRAELMKGKG